MSTTALSLGRWLRANNRAPFFVALIIFVATLAAYLYYWSNLRANVEKDKTTAYNRQVRLLHDKLDTRLQLYETLLRGGAGLFMLNNQINSDNWNQYFQPYEVTENYPDIQGIGFARYITAGQRDEFIAERQAIDPAYTISPAGDRQAYTPIVFVARYTGNKGTSVGYDGFSDITRREAMTRAITSGQPVISGQVKLRTDPQGRPAFIMYLPIYTQGMPISTPGERQAAFYGFSYLSIDAAIMFKDLQSGDANPHFAFKVVDPALTKSNPDAPPAYRSENYTDIIKRSDSTTGAATVKLYGRTYDFTYAGAAALISAAERQLPLQTLLRGIFSSLLFATLVWYLITYRERKLNHWKQKEVQTAKDDLLSLASHQLRTPATVVKQYVGMLLQGYGGQLTEQQINMLTSAYESNERQLEIINQLLYVARLDAGRISLRKEEVDLPKLAKSVITDQKQAALDRNQTVEVRLPKTLTITADPRYLRMVLENLLSNAIKYTPEGGTVTVVMEDQATEVSLSVTDTGVGLEPKHIGTIFDKFTRIENILSTDVNGSGVGLYLTKEIITLHGGRIDVASTLGKGSTFTVTLPKEEP